MKGACVPPPFFPPCPSVCVRGAACGEPFLKPSSCSHFLGVMDAAAAQWQRAGLRGPGVNSAPARPGCRTCGWQRTPAGRLPQGWAHGDSRRQDTLPASAGSELGRALSSVQCSRLYYARFLPCFTTVSEPEAEICWLFIFFFFLLACQGQRALSCFMSFLRRRPSQQSVAAWSSVLLCAS